MRHAALVIGVLLPVLIAGWGHILEAEDAVRPADEKIEIEDPSSSRSSSAEAGAAADTEVKAETVVAREVSLLSDPNYSRLMFAPSGHPLRKGDGYFSDHYVVFPGFAYGLTDHLSLSGGMSVVPATGFSEQIFYVSPMAGTRLSKDLWLSGGFLFAQTPFDTDLHALTMGFAVAGYERPRGAFSIGVGFSRIVEELYDDRGQEREEARYTPIVLLGAKLPLGKRLALVSESWLILGEGMELGEQPLGLSLRFFGDRLSADVGFVVNRAILDAGFPVPWLSFSYHFGPSRNGHATARTLPPALVPGRGRR